LIAELSLDKRAEQSDANNFQTTFGSSDSFSTTTSFEVLSAKLCFGATNRFVLPAQQLKATATEEEASFGKLDSCSYS